MTAIKIAITNMTKTVFKTILCYQENVALTTSWTMLPRLKGRLGPPQARAIIADKEAVTCGTHRIDDNDVAQQIDAILLRRSCYAPQ